jgi:cobalamin-dependent methionine synthase I
MATVKGRCMILVKYCFFVFGLTIMKSDLGVMVAPENYCSSIEHNVDIIGLSGLITPSWMKWFIWPKGR